MDFVEDQEQLEAADVWEWQARLVKAAAWAGVIPSVEESRGEHETASGNMPLSGPRW